MSTPVVEVPIQLAPDFKPVGYVLESDGLWFRRPRGQSWHLMRPAGGLRSWCGLAFTKDDLTRVIHVTWPWTARGCWSCMDRRWPPETDLEPGIYTFDADGNPHPIEDHVAPARGCAVGTIAALTFAAMAVLVVVATRSAS